MLSAAALTLAACGSKAESDKSVSVETHDAEHVEKTVEALFAPDALAEVLSAQPDETKARYQYRHPQETLEFFGVAPGSTVVEVLPGGGWYSKLLLPYLGDDGTLIGVDYALTMWPEFGAFANAEFLEKKKTWPTTWTEGAQEWRAGSNADIKAFAFENRDTSLDGSVDYVLFIRALHNMARFEEKGGYLTRALADTHALLKPGGIVGVVQHRAPAGNDDSWADGNNGYLKQDAVIALMDKAGFDFIAASEVNANPNDKPTNEDIVWRLPPSFGTSAEDPELKAKLTAVGESDRMTLKFRKK
jgi:predicted methyltransferase